MELNKFIKARKKIIFFLGIVFVNLLFLEVFSFLCLFFMGKAHWNYEDSLKSFLSPSFIFSGHHLTGELTDIYNDLFSGNVPHPYFAFQYDGSSYSDDKDVHGFYGDVRFPFEKQSTDFIVCIGGGSVSDQFARYVLYNQNNVRSRFEDTLRIKYPKLKNKNIKIVGLGKGGNKQPQQFFIVSYLLKYLDLVINLDGFNEFADEASIEYPIEFPPYRGHYSYLMGVDRENHNLHRYIHNIMFFRGLSDLIRFERSISILRFSHSYFLFQQLSYVFFARKILKNLLAIYTEKSDNITKETYFAHLYEKGTTSLKAEVWKRFSLQQYRLSKLYGVQSVFFLQPIPVILDAKIWSREEIEKKYFTDDPDVRKFVNLMRDEIRTLCKKKLPFYDLSYIFKDVKETVYSDPIHLNLLGLEILFQGILTILRSDNCS